MRSLRVYSNSTMRADVVSTFSLLVLVCWVSWRLIGDLSFSMLLVALSSLCGLISFETSTRATKHDASQTFPGVLMGVTLPAALMHLGWLTSQCAIHSSETEMLSCSTQAFKIAHTKEKAALPFVVCFLWILFNPKFYSVEITAVVSALIVFIVFILNLNVRWVLMQTITTHAVSNAFSHAVASDNLHFELLLLQNALGIMFDDILMLNPAPAPVIIKIVCIGTSYTIIYGAVMTNFLRCIPKSTGVRFQIQTVCGVAFSFLLFVVLLLYSITHSLGRSAVLWIADSFPRFWIEVFHLSRLVLLHLHHSYLRL